MIRPFFSVLMVLLMAGLAGAEITKDQIQGLLPPGSPVIESIRFNHDLKLFEVVTQGQVFYMTEDLRYAFIGSIIDLRTKRNLTAESIREARKIDFASLPKENAIKISEGKRAMAVFTDPACSFCKKLHVELKKLKDVAVYIYLYPLDDEGVKRAIDIWCSENRVQSYEAAIEGKRLKPSSCQDHPIMKNISIGKKMFINSTPVIITDRNTVINGYADIERLRSVLRGE